MGRPSSLPLARIIWAATCALAACAPDSEPDFDARDPALRIDAMKKAVQEHDRSSVPAIVEQLDSDDPAVRLCAANALKELAVSTEGYQYDDPPRLRRAAIERILDVAPPGRAEAPPEPEPPESRPEDKTGDV